MKLVGLLLSLLIVAVLVTLQVRSMTGAGDTDPATSSGEPDERFSDRCREIAPPKVPRPDDYCRCLWQRGVRRVTHLVTDPRAKQVAETCQRMQQSSPQ